MRPKREPATNNQQTYMVTTETWGRRSLFENERWASLLIDTLYHYRGTAYFLHEFVVMPEHIHVLITPLGGLEKAVQFIKGGFSFRAKKELGSNMEVWQPGFQDHRIRDAADFVTHVGYIRENPVCKHLCEWAGEYAFSSACAGFELDGCPQGLKPLSREESSGAAEAAPLQSKTSKAVVVHCPEGISPLIDPPGLKPLSREESSGAAEAAPLQSKTSEAVVVHCPEGISPLIDPQGLKPLSREESSGAAEAAPLQSKTIEGGPIRDKLVAAGEAASFQSSASNKKIA